MSFGTVSSSEDRNVRECYYGEAQVIFGFCFSVFELMCCGRRVETNSSGASIRITSSSACTLVRVSHLPLVGSEEKQGQAAERFSSDLLFFFV